MLEGKILKDRYKITGKIGVGHYADVWLSIDVHDNSKQYVIKICSTASEKSEQLEREYNLKDFIDHHISCGNLWLDCIRMGIQ